MFKTGYSVFSYLTALERFAKFITESMSYTQSGRHFLTVYPRY